MFDMADIRQIGRVAKACLELSPHSTCWFKLIVICFDLNCTEEILFCFDISVKLGTIFFFNCIDRTRAYSDRLDIFQTFLIFFFKRFKFSPLLYPTHNTFRRPRLSLVAFF